MSVKAWAEDSSKVVFNQRAFQKVGRKYEFRWCIQVGWWWYDLPCHDVTASESSSLSFQGFSAGLIWAQRRIWGSIVVEKSMSRASIEVLSDDDEAPLAAAAPAASATAVKSKAQPNKLPDEVEEQPDVKKTSDETEETTASPKKPSKPKKKNDPKPAAKPPAAKGKAKAKAKSAVKAKAKPKSGTRKKVDDTTKVKDAKKDTTEKDAFDEEPRPSDSMKRPAASTAAKKRPAKGSGAEYKAEKYKYHKKEMWGVRCNGTEYCTVRRSDSNFCYLLILKRRAIQVAAGILIFFFARSKRGPTSAMNSRWISQSWAEMQSIVSSCSKFKIQHHILVAVAFLEAHWLLLLLLGLHWFSCRKLAALLAWMVNPNKRWKILQPEPQTLTWSPIHCVSWSRHALPNKFGQGFNAIS